MPEGTLSLYFFSKVNPYSLFKFIIFCYSSLFTFLWYTIVYRAIARLNKSVRHKSYIARADCFNRVFDCSIRVYRLANYFMGLGPATSKFGHAIAWYTRVSTIKVLSLTFNTVNNLHYVYRRSWQACRQMLVYNNAYAIKNYHKTICWSLIILLSYTSCQSITWKHRAC